MPMTERVMDLSEEPAKLSVRRGQLLVEMEQGEASVPLSDLAVLVVSHPAVRYTHAVLTGICAAGGSFVLCNEKHLPTGMLLPLEAHFVQAERFTAQANVSLPTKKQLWKQIVRAKVTAQGHLLVNFRGKDMGLIALAGRVRSGDPDNMEAQASRRYWPALFGKEFRREPSLEDHNRLLNYGYAVLRAVVARAVCAAGLHPSLGLHHHNRYNTFCLADDLMEPLRPLVDGVVVGIVDKEGTEAPLEKATKARIVAALMNARFNMEGERRTLFDTMSRVGSSLAAVYLGKRKRLILPEL